MCFCALFYCFWCFLCVFGVLGLSPITNLVKFSINRIASAVTRWMFLFWKFWEISAFCEKFRGTCGKRETKLNGPGVIPIDPSIYSELITRTSYELTNLERIDELTWIVEIGIFGVELNKRGVSRV